MLSTRFAVTIALCQAAVAGALALLAPNAPGYLIALAGGVMAGIAALLFLLRAVEPGRADGDSAGPGAEPDKRLRSWLSRNISDVRRSISRNGRQEREGGRSGWRLTIGIDAKNRTVITAGTRRDHDGTANSCEVFASITPTYDVIVVVDPLADQALADLAVDDLIDFLIAVGAAHGADIRPPRERARILQAKSPEPALPAPAPRAAPETLPADPLTVRLRTFAQLLLDRRRAGDEELDGALADARAICLRLADHVERRPEDGGGARDLVDYVLPTAERMLEDHAVLVRLGGPTSAEAAGQVRKALLRLPELLEERVSSAGSMLALEATTRSEAFLTLTQTALRTGR